VGFRLRRSGSCGEDSNGEDIERARRNKWVTAFGANDFVRCGGGGGGASLPFLGYSNLSISIRAASASGAFFVDHAIILSAVEGM